MQLAFFSNPLTAKSVKRVFDRYLDKLNILYVFESLEGINEFKDYYHFISEKDCDYSFLKSYPIDTVLVYGWDHRIPVEEHTDIPFYNVHPSLLPQYKGPDPITFQILKKEQRSGVTIHRMDETFDSGPIYKQKEFKLNFDGNLNEIFLRFSLCANQLIHDFLRDLLDSNIKLTNQTDINSSYFSYRDLQQFIVNSDMEFNDFYRICKVFNRKYPVIVSYKNKLYTLASYSAEEKSGYVEFCLADKKVYFQFHE